MAYKDLIAKQVSKAFKLAKDLAVPVTFNRALNNGFDFETSSVEETNNNFSVNAFILDTTNKKESSEVKKTLILEAKVVSIDDVNSCSSVVIDGNEWSIIPPAVSNGFTIEVTVGKM